MEPARALARRKSEPVTPYIWRAWQHALVGAGLVDRYPSVVQGLHDGFHASFPEIRQTQTPPNRPSIHEFRGPFEEIVQGEVDKGRYIGPFTRNELEDLIGPFQSSPFSIIPKAGKPGKYRIIQNFSYPLAPTTSFPNPSVNSATLASDFPCTWGTFNITCATITSLPPGSQAAVRDVSEAYRTIPLHHSQWAACVAQVGLNRFFVDPCAAFGARPSGGIYGSVGDAATDVFRSRGIGPLLKWVDDNIFFRVPTQHLAAYNRLRGGWRRMVAEQGVHSSGGRRWFGEGAGRDGLGFEAVEDFTFPLQDLSGTFQDTDSVSGFAYSFKDIDRVSAELGIPWEVSKDTPFGAVVTYIGLVWDMDRRTVGLGLAKRAKYLAGITEWRARERHVLEDVQRLYGRLLHASLVVPAGRAYLVGFESMLGLFVDSPMVARHAVQSIASDLEWWAQRLGSPVLERPICSPHDILDYSAFSDASSEVGIAIVIGERWRAWRLIPGWKTLGGVRDIAWAEAVGFELLVDAVLRIAPPGRHVRVYGDNMGVVKGWWNGRSRNRQVNEIFKCIHEKLEARNAVGTVHTTYTRSKSNPADGPSRGIFPPTSLLLPDLPIPARAAGFLVDALGPPTPAELRTRRRGGYDVKPKPAQGSGSTNSDAASPGIHFGYAEAAGSLYAPEAF
jgi:hypothetical protein